MRRVLFLINGEHYAGAERVQDLLALNLAALGWRVDFVCLKHGVFERSREARNSAVTILPMHSHFDLRPVREVTKLLLEGHYDLLHTHTSRSALIGHLAAARARTPMVHHVHSPTAQDTESRWRNRINSAVERISLRGVRRLIAVSASTGRHLQRLGYAESRIRVVPNGVPVLASARDWRAPKHRWVLGMAALFRPRKGVEVLLAALALLVARGLPLRLRAVGGFESEAYRCEVLALADALGVARYVDWVGFTRGMTTELAQMDLFVVPSLYGEGLPMVLIEAMSTGLPVVATTNEGIPEVLDLGRAGALVPPGDVAALADALEGLMREPEKAAEFARAGLSRQRERYSDLAMARGTAMVYHELTGAGV